MSLVKLLVDVIFWPPLFQLVIAPGLVAALVIVIFILWFERKTAARVQMRIGPLHVSPQLGGALQLIADLIRYSMQEIIVPRAVDKAVFIVAPLAALVASILPLVAVPMSPLPSTWPIPMEYSVLVALALTTVSPLFIIAAGWSSNNKFAVIGGMREAYLITAYELIAVLSMLAAAVAVPSLNMVDVVEAQSSGKLLALLNPLAFLAASIAVLMATSGFPFEIPEAENEIVAGAFTEYSGLMYGINMGAAYIKRFVYSVLITLLFLGGWKPLDPAPGAGLLAGYVAPTLVILAKATVLMAVFSFLRAVYGRYRLDQALDVAWRVVFPLALLGFGWSLVLAYLGVM